MSCTYYIIKVHVNGKPAGRRFYENFKKLVNPILLSGKLGDGRAYPYIYIPVKTANEIRKDVEKFLIKNEIHSMLYKVGIDSPSETIETK